MSDSLLSPPHPATQSPKQRPRPAASEGQASAPNAAATSPAQPSRPFAPHVDPQRRGALWGRLLAARGLLRGLLTRRGIAQVQGTLYVLGGVWTWTLGWREGIATPHLRLVVGVGLGLALLRLARRQASPRAMAWLGIIAAVTQLTERTLALGPGAPGLSLGLHIMGQMAFVGWWVACLVERSRAHRVHPALQPRPGRPLFG